MSTFQYKDYLTGEDKSFDTVLSHNGDAAWMYTKGLIPNYSSILLSPIFVGNLYPNKSFISNNNSITFGNKINIFISGGFDVIVLDSLPIGLSPIISTNSAAIKGTNSQINFFDIPDSKYPTSISNYNRCYFKMRIQSRNFPDIYYAEWLYYIVVRYDWSSLRDAYILASNEKFSFDEKNIINNIDFINSNKQKGYYL